MGAVRRGAARWRREAVRTGEDEVEDLVADPPREVAPVPPDDVQTFLLLDLAGRRMSRMRVMGRTITAVSSTAFALFLRPPHSPRAAVWMHTATTAHGARAPRFRPLR